MDDKTQSSKYGQNFLLNHFIFHVFLLYNFALRKPVVNDQLDHPSLFLFCHGIT